MKTRKKYLNNFESHLKVYFDIKTQVDFSTFSLRQTISEIFMKKQNKPRFD